MKRVAIAGLLVVVVGSVAGSALASNGNHGVAIYDSTPAGALPGNIPSLGPEAYAFGSLGDKITFSNGSARRLTNVVVTLSSWACQQGTWFDKNCLTKPGATFSQPITLTIWNADRTKQLASSTQTFEIPYRPSASGECSGTDLGKWYQSSAKRCFNGLATDVTFNFAGNVTLPNTVVYEISYDTNDYGPNPLHVAGPYDSLNIGITDGPSVGSTADPFAWTDGAMNADFAGTPAVQFKAARLWKVN